MEWFCVRSCVTLRLMHGLAMPLLVFESLYFLFIFISFDVYHERFLYSVWLSRGDYWEDKQMDICWLWKAVGWRLLMDFLWSLRFYYSHILYFLMCLFCVLMLYGNLVVSVSELLCGSNRNYKSIQQFHPLKNNSKNFQGIGEFYDFLFLFNYVNII